VLIMVEGVDFKDLSAGYVDGLRTEVVQHFNKKSADFNEFST
jgi:hypothetical protein